MYKFQSIMKNIIIAVLLLWGGSLLAQTQTIRTSEDDLTITPISHATMVWEWNEKVIYFDPSGDVDMFKPFNIPDLVLITDIHGDHMNKETLKSLNLSEATLIAPMAVAVELKDMGFKKIEVVNNGEQIDIMDIHIEAIPMYNLPQSKSAFHVKGRGDGYVVTIDKIRLYVSGDTEDIPEMRNLKNIDYAFVCMNLPYTMTVEQAASAVLQFKPKQVYPYHYRGGEGKFSDVNAFQAMVQDKNPNIEVVLLNWYP